MSSQNFLLLLISLGYFIAYVNLLLALPHRFEDNAYKSTLGERAYANVGMSLCTFAALMYFAVGHSYKMFPSWQWSVIIPVFRSILLLCAAIVVSTMILRRKYVRKVLAAWTRGVESSPAEAMIIIRQENRERKLVLREGYAAFVFGPLPGGGLGVFMNELTQLYGHTVRVVDGEVLVRISAFPLTRKKLLEGAQRIPGYIDTVLLHDGERLVIK
jgi:hypothetical protein